MSPAVIGAFAQTHSCRCGAVDRVFLSFGVYVVLFCCFYLLLGWGGSKKNLCASGGGR